MKIIEPNVELWKQTDVVNHVARCARICYRKETGNDDKLYRSLLNRKHNSMFRHATYYYIVNGWDIDSNNYNVDLHWITELNKIINKYKQLIVGIDIKYYRNNYYIVINGNWALDYKYLFDTLLDYQVEDKVFANVNEIAWNMMRYTFKVTTQISTSRELNRVSPNNIVEQSTRYVYEDGTLCRPHWMTDEEVEIVNTDSVKMYYTCNERLNDYIYNCSSSFGCYKRIIEQHEMPRQDARGVLPIDTATVCAYTYSVAEYRAIIDLRYYGTTGQPHPNAKIIAGMIREELMNLGYEFR